MEVSGKDMVAAQKAARKREEERRKRLLSEYREELESNLREAENQMGANREKMKQEALSDPESSFTNADPEPSYALFDPADVELDQVEKLAALQCTTKEIAAFLGCSKQQFEKAMKVRPLIAQAVERGREKGKTSLRRLQFKLAEKNPAMAIFLGKNYLNQTDKVQQELSGRDGGPVEVREGLKKSILTNAHKLAGLEDAANDAERSEERGQAEARRSNRSD